MTTILRSTVAAFLLSLLTACVSTQGMALEADLSELDTSAESIALLAVDTENALVPDYHPDVNGVRIRPIVAEDAPAGAGASKWFTANSAARTATGSYLLSVQLAPGRYEVMSIRGVATALLIRGNFDFPIGVHFDVDADEVAYIGHVKMVNREREEGETRSGSVFPLVDQAVTGFAKGTFDVTFSDDFEQDRASFVEAYPILQGRSVVSRVGQRETEPE